MRGYELQDGCVFGWVGFFLPKNEKTVGWVGLLINGINTRVLIHS